MNEHLNWLSQKHEEMKNKSVFRRINPDIQFPSNVVKLNDNHILAVSGTKIEGFVELRDSKLEIE